MFFAIPTMSWSFTPNDVHDERLCTAIDFGDFGQILFQIDRERPFTKSWKRKFIGSIGKLERQRQFGG